ncbi:hypothetical protein BHE90_001291 [Fusarium euwallaceae]|uniref:Carboxymuconolactone decarboxylase-like domain-containing protein n=3 Tax=Fusarium solani species complex TaxID=232080 RepID=A0A3M2SLI1_9HYPO|nr:hypothetical protein CDV36_001898 [Fusarium kuroshium]RSL80797.1 hypothetical protein CEP51_006298 [Fusarium floridanum]RTE84221.1 hypothetical protein BHE90_001291 [Fusarium euwallaceae]
MATDKITPSVSKLLEEVEAIFAHTSQLSERWYLVALAALAGGNDPVMCKDLYLYLISKPDFSEPNQRRALIRRIREGLIKCIAVIGVCKPIEAILAINEVERDEDKDHSISREGWQCDEANLKRGNDWMQKLYSKNMDETMSFFRDHRDFEWVSRHISYGLYLSDRQVLDDIDTEIVVLSSIMIQNLEKETHWHIRGSRRLGISRVDVEAIHDSVGAIAGHLGISLHRVPSVERVERDV